MSDLSKRILAESDWENIPEGYEDMLSLIVENPRAMGRVFPPVGYEEDLLKNIRRRTQRSFSLRDLKVWEFLWGNKLGWALSVLLFGSTFWSTWTLLSQKSTSKTFAHSALEKIMRHSREGDVKRWLASLNVIEDRDTLMKTESIDLLSSDPFVVAFQLESDQLKRVVEKFSQDVRKIHND